MTLYEVWSYIIIQENYVLNKFVMPHTKVVTVSLTKKSIKITAEKNMNTKLIERKHPEFIVSIYCHCVLYVTL